MDDDRRVDIPAGRAKNPKYIHSRNFPTNFELHSGITFWNSRLWYPTYPGKMFSTFQAHYFGIVGAATVSLAATSNAGHLSS